MILVTGASGFVGSHLCNRLVKEGYQVLGITHNRINPMTETLLQNKNFKVVNGDIIDEKFVRSIFLNNEIDTVFHLAAHIPNASGLDYMGVNVKGTCTLLTESDEYNVSNFIYASSMSVYSEPTVFLPVTEEHPVGNTNSYGVSKLQGESACKRFSNNMIITILRYASVYGKGCRQPLVVARFVDFARNNLPLTIYGDGSQSSDFVYIDDVINGNLLAWRKDKSDLYNIGSGQEITILELAQNIIKIFNSKSEIVFAEVESTRPFRFYSDISKAKIELGYSPMVLAEGLKLYAKELLDV